MPLGALFDAITSISLTVLAYIAILFLYTRIRERREERARYTFTILSELRFMNVEWVDALAGTKAYLDARKNGLPFDEVPNDENFNKTIDHLGRLELLALAIRKAVIAEDIVYDFLHVTVLSTFENTRALIDQMRKDDSNPAIYSDFEALARRWSDRKPD